MRPRTLPSALKVPSPLVQKDVAPGQGVWPVKSKACSLVPVSTSSSHQTIPPLRSVK